MYCLESFCRVLSYSVGTNIIFTKKNVSRVEKKTRTGYSSILMSLGFTHRNPNFI